MLASRWRTALCFGCTYTMIGQRDAKRCENSQNDAKNLKNMQKLRKRCKNSQKDAKTLKKMQKL